MSTLKQLAAAAGIAVVFGLIIAATARQTTCSDAKPGPSIASSIKIAGC